MNTGQRRYVQPNGLEPPLVESEAQIASYCEVSLTCSHEGQRPGFGRHNKLVAHAFQQTLDGNKESAKPSGSPATGVLAFSWALSWSCGSPHRVELGFVKGAKNVLSQHSYFVRSKKQRKDTATR
jgi:hypothetical protein